MKVASVISDWSAPNQERARKLLETYPEKRSAVMPLLYLASLEGGHLTTAGMVQVAQLTGLTSAQVQSVASFYTMYKRDHVGRYLISVCTSISCFLMGADEVLAAVECESGGRTAPPAQTTFSAWSTSNALELAVERRPFRSTTSWSKA